jgi:hypothetical protein
MTNHWNLADITIRTELQPGDIGYVILMHGAFYQQEYGYGVSFEAYVAGGFYEFFRQFDSQLDRVWITCGTKGINAPTFGPPMNSLPPPASTGKWVLS